MTNAFAIDTKSATTTLSGSDIAIGYVMAPQSGDGSSVNVSVSQDDLTRAVGSKIEQGKREALKRDPANSPAARMQRLGIRTRQTTRPGAYGMRAYDRLKNVLGQHVPATTLAEVQKEAPKFSGSVPQAKTIALPAEAIQQRDTQQQHRMGGFEILKLAAAAAVGDPLVLASVVGNVLTSGVKTSAQTDDMALTYGSRKPGMRPNMQTWKPTVAPRAALRLENAEAPKPFVAGKVPQGVSVFVSASNDDAALRPRARRRDLYPELTMR